VKVGSQASAEFEHEQGQGMSDELGRVFSANGNYLAASKIVSLTLRAKR
jgi:hypothetical protein